MNKLLFLLIFVFFHTARHAVAQVTDTSAQWIWAGGTTATLVTANYGTKGVAYPASGTGSHYPGARLDPVTWTDTAGNLYVFGGFYNLANTFQDIWKYSPDDDTWTWIHGAEGYLKDAIAGIQTVPDAANVPGSRGSGGRWVDSAGNLWIFGGRWRQNGIRRNDLWKFDMSTGMWVWMNGNTANVDVAGNYGTKGVSAASNQPGSRGYGWPANWVDHDNGKLYLFGGVGRDRNNAEGSLSDLWVFDMASNEWTWIGGGDVRITSNTARFGAKYVEDPLNYPLGRQNMACWQDTLGYFWMFGGNANNVSSVNYNLNDLWRYNPATNMWAWMGGDTTLAPNPGHFGVYGQRGVPDAANKPGSRNTPITWVDVHGKFWMYGGWGVGESGGLGELNDVWRFDPYTNEWTWMFGDKNVGPGQGRAGVYTSLGAVGQPGGRRMCGGWVDKDGNFWLYGGEGMTNTTTIGIRSDLWKLEAIIPPVPDQPDPFTVAKTNVCVGESNVTYTVPAVSGANTYDWEYSGTNATFTASTTAPTNTVSFATNATSGTLRVRAAGSGGNSPWRDTSITVNALPTVTSTNTGNQTICAGESLSLTASGTSGVTYQWKRGTTNVGTGANYQAQTAGSYTVTATVTATGCSATSTPPTALTVTLLPYVNISPATVAICAGESATLTASGAITYTWSPSGGNSATATVSPGTTTTYTVTGTTSGCSSTASRQVTVNPLPTVASTNTGNQAICDGDSLLLTASGTSGVNYQWKRGSTNVGAGTTYYATIAGAYTVTATNPNTNCSATSNPSTILTVNSMPVASVTVGGATEICTGESVTLTGPIVSGATAAYQWMDGSTNVGTNSISYTATATGAYRVAVTFTSTGCSDTSAPVDVLVYDRPSVSLEPGDTAFCDGGLVTLEVESQDTGLTYLWKNGSTVIPQASASFLEISETGDYTVSVGRAAVAGCDTTTNEVTVTVHPLPVVDVTWDGETLQATAGFASYQWNTSGQGIPGATNASYVPASDGSYSVTATDGNGCSTTSTVQNITVGVDDLTALNAQIKIYPNPTTGNIYITAPIAVSVSLSSVDGKLLLHGDDIRQIDMGHYANGVYMLRIMDADGLLIRHEKIVKQH